MLGVATGVATGGATGVATGVAGGIVNRSIAEELRMPVLEGMAPDVDNRSILMP